MKGKRQNVATSLPTAILRDSKVPQFPKDRAYIKKGCTTRRPTKDMRQLMQGEVTQGDDDMGNENAEYNLSNLR